MPIGRIRHENPLLSTRRLHERGPQLHWEKMLLNGQILQQALTKSQKLTKIIQAWD